jgi:hypothetical protein
MKKITSILFIILFSGCGFQPLYLNNNLSDVTYSEIISKGDEEINKNIINRIFIKEDKSNQQLDKFNIESSFTTKITSKNSKGQVTSYLSELYVEIEIISKNEIIKNKKFLEKFSYNNKENKFELIQYQNKIQKNLVNKIVKDVIVYLNIK